MHAYIEVFANKKVERNAGLYAVLVYVGKRENKTAHKLSDEEAYKLGKKHIAKLAKHFSGRAIGFVVNPVKKDVNPTTKKWKLHKYKVRIVFAKLAKYLSEADAPAVIRQSLNNAWLEMIQAGCIGNTTHFLGYPWYTEIKLLLASPTMDKLSGQEVAALKKISLAVESAGKVIAK